MRQVTLVLALAFTLGITGCSSFSTILVKNPVNSPANNTVASQPAAASTSSAPAQVTEQRPSASELARQMLQDLSNGFAFGVNETQLNSQAKGSIAALADVLKLDPSMKIEVQGHADSSGNKKQNSVLAQRRADAVKSELLKQGVKSNQIASIGKGDTLPRVPNNTAANRAQNRRAQLFLK